jgi:hypothetical protein
MVAVALAWALWAAPGAAQETIDLYDTTEANLGWAPADGPVSGYYVVVARNGGDPAVDAIVTEASATITAELGDSIVVTVNAYDDTGVPGPASQPSPMIRFNASSGDDGTGDPPPPDEDDPPVDPPVEPPVVAHAMPDDFTGNGTSDLLLSGEHEFALWGLDPGAPPEDLTPTQPASSWRHAGTGDLDGNGAMDLVMENDGTGDVMAMLFADGDVIDGGLIDLEPTTGSHHWRVVGMGDLDGDGRDDLVRRSTTGNQAQLVFMTGIQPASTRQLEAGPGETQIASIEDLDADGVDELVWLDPTRRTLSLWDMQGDVAEVATLAELGDGWQVIGAGDFDGDGAADLFARHGTGPLEVWRLSGAAIFETLPLPDTNDASPLSIADFDGDGLADLALRKHGTNDIVSWYSDGAGVGEGLLLTSNEWAPPATDGLADRLCAADVDGDGRIRGADRSALESCLGQPASGDCAFADLDGNGYVSDQDLAILNEYWGSRVCQKADSPPGKGYGKGKGKK